MTISGAMLVILVVIIVSVSSLCGFLLAGFLAEKQWKESFEELEKNLKEKEEEIFKKNVLFLNVYSSCYNKTLMILAYSDFMQGKKRADADINGFMDEVFSFINKTKDVNLWISWFDVYQSHFSIFEILEQLGKEDAKSGRFHADNPSLADLKNFDFVLKTLDNFQKELFYNAYLNGYEIIKKEV